MSIIKNTTNKTFQVNSGTCSSYQMIESSEHLQVKEIIQNMNLNEELKITLLQTVVGFGYWDEQAPNCCFDYNTFMCGPNGFSVRTHATCVPENNICVGKSADCVTIDGDIINNSCCSGRICRKEDYIDQRLVIDPKLLSTQIVIKMSNDMYQKLIAELEAKRSLFKLTAGPRGNIYKTLAVTKLYEVVKIVYGVFKLPDFDEAFTAYKKLYSLIHGESDEILTELHFAKYNINRHNLTYNPKLVCNRPVFEMEGSVPLETFSIDRRSLQSDNCEVILTNHNVDLSANMETLKEILALFT